MKFIKFSDEKLVTALTFFCGLILYLPTLWTGFLTDDFLDCSHKLTEVPIAFVGEAGGGYRPLMVFSWALDNALWDVTGQWGWHLTNLIILAGAVAAMRLFLRCFIHSKLAMNAATAFFVFSGPVAVSVARVSWRTTLLALIPLLLSVVFYHKWGRCTTRKRYLVCGSILYLISLLFKETGLTAFPVLAFASYCGCIGDSKKRTFITALFAALGALTVYGVLRYLAMGFSVNYGESTQFGLFMVRTLLVQNAAPWSPWLSGIPVRILLLVFASAVYFAAHSWPIRILLGSLGIFMILPVSNLPARSDLAVAAMPAAVLFAANLVQRLQGSRAIIPLFLVFLAGVFSQSIDQVKILGEASKSVEVQSERIARISAELPGRGPVLFHGVEETVGGFGTFWPGDYTTPLICAGIESQRYLGGVERLWESLLGEEPEGYLVFFQRYPDYPAVDVSLNMYRHHEDTLVSTRGPFQCGDLIGYASCFSRSERALGLFLSGVSDSITWISGESFHESWMYGFDLASSPLWLSGDSNLVVVHSGGDLLFSSRNISLERAQERLEDKRVAI